MTGPTIRSTAHPTSATRRPSRRAPLGRSSRRAAYQTRPAQPRSPTSPRESVAPGGVSIGVARDPAPAPRCAGISARSSSQADARFSAGLPRGYRRQRANPPTWKDSAWVILRANMVTEGICLAVVQRLRGQRYTMTSTLNLETSRAPCKRQPVYERRCDAPDLLIRHLLATYPLADIESAIRWLEIGEYVATLAGACVMPRRCSISRPRDRVRDAGRLDAVERDLLYQEDPYAAFVARQFAAEDDDYSRSSRIAFGPDRNQAFDGRVDGIEAFRGEILRKIRLARFFVCILTRRADCVTALSPLACGSTRKPARPWRSARSAHSVEAGLGEHYAGDLQRTTSTSRLRGRAGGSHERWLGSRASAAGLRGGVPRGRPAHRQ